MTVRSSEARAVRRDDLPVRLSFRGRAGALRRSRLRTLQINVGKVCNQACAHCHVSAGPHRVEAMDGRTADRVIDLIARPPIEAVDITGGAPELNPHFRRLILAARKAGRRVIDRCNLTVLFERGQEDLADFLALHEVEVVASLPCYTQDNVDRQRGRGVFEKSIAALRRLNALGYGTRLPLHLVYNPLGPELPPSQPSLEADYRLRLSRDHGVVFHSLYVMANMPVGRFRHVLDREGRTADYMQSLEAAYSAAAVPRVMCRELLSMGWDGTLYDCDFNQMLDAPLQRGGRALTIWDLGATDLGGWEIASGNHCYGCTAGAGSGCGGTLLRDQ